MNRNNICQMVARLMRRLLSATVSNDLQNAVLTDFAIMCKVKYRCFCERFTTAQKTHSSFATNVFLQMKNRKMLKTCFEMKHKYREIVLKRAIEISLPSFLIFQCSSIHLFQKQLLWLHL